jgi:predicted MFS family arabinose efflux permease
VEAVEPQHAGAAIGYNLLLLSLGTMIGPAAFGFAVQAMDYGTAWTALAVLVLAGAALYHASAVVARR